MVLTGYARPPPWCLGTDMVRQQMVKDVDGGVDQGNESREIKSHGVEEVKWEERKTCYPASSARNLEFKNHQSVGRVFC